MSNGPSPSATTDRAGRGGHEEHGGYGEDAPDGDGRGHDGAMTPSSRHGQPDEDRRRHQAERHDGTGQPRRLAGAARRSNQAVYPS